MTNSFTPLDWYPIRNSVNAPRPKLSLDTLLSHAYSPPIPFSPTPPSSPEKKQAVARRRSNTQQENTQPEPSDVNTDVFGRLPELGRCVVVKRARQDESPTSPVLGQGPVRSGDGHGRSGQGPGHVQDRSITSWLF